MKDVTPCNAPLYDEIGVTRLYDKVVQIQGMAQYFPDKYPKGRKCDRQYMFNVWNSVDPAGCKKVIEHANKVRYSISGEK